MSQDRLSADPTGGERAAPASAFDARNGHGTYGAWPEQRYAPQPAYGAPHHAPYGRAPAPAARGGFPGPAPAGLPAPRLNSIAVLALCMAFLAPPAGIVLGVVARNQVKRTGEAGAGLALSAILVGAGVLLVVAVYAVAVLSFVAAAVPG